MSPVYRKDDLIFGHSWEAIQRAQRGGSLHGHIDISKDSCPAATPEEAEGDRQLLEKHGEHGLRDRQYFGVIDRLQRAGLIK